MGKKVTVDLTKEERVNNYLAHNKKKKEWDDQLSRSTGKKKIGDVKRQKNINYLNYDQYEEEFEF